MFLFGCQVRISIFTKRSGLPSLERIERHSALIFKSRRITTGNTIVGQNTETAYKIILFQSLHKKFFGENIRKSHFGIILPAYIVTKSSIIVRAQSQINVIAVQETDIFLNKVAVIIQIA